MKTIVIAHPQSDSYHHAVAHQIKATFETQGETVTMIDLYADQFNPVMSLDDLSLFTTGTSSDAQVAPYQKAIDASDHLVFVYPIWWFGAPAILKGFLDKVLLPNFAYGIHEDGSFYGLLDNIKHIDVITCAFATQQTLETVTKDPIQTVFMDVSLGRCFKQAAMDWHHCGDIANASHQRTSEFLEQTVEAITKK